MILVIGNVQISIRKAEPDSREAERWFHAQQVKKQIRREREALQRRFPEIRIN